MSLLDAASLATMRARLSAGLAHRYLLGEPLGEGGMAVVFEARDLGRQRKVALKVLHPDLTQLVGGERFRREILLTTRLRHPGIISIYDSGQVDGYLWYAMARVDGESLRQRLTREMQLPVEEAVRLTAEAARAIAVAHRDGIIHRDLKPENLLLTRQGRVVVVDFGVARSLQGADLTRTGLVLGTPLYMSPEQAGGAGRVDVRSDIYALGCVLYEMLAGEPPYSATTPQALTAKHLHAAIPDVRIIRGTVGGALQAVISRALAKSPVDRYQDCEELAAALLAAVGQPDEPRHSRAKLRPLLTAAGLLLVLAVPAWFAVRGIRPAPPAARLATRPTIAVLYFQDRSRDGSLRAFADGLTEEVIHELSGAGNALRVISTFGVRPFRDRIVPFDSLVRVLRPSVVVEGSVTLVDGQILVRANLVSPADGTYLDSTSVERPTGDLGRLSRDVAQEVASALRRQLGQEVRLTVPSLGTSSTAAAQLQLEGERARQDAAALGRGRDTSGVIAAFEALHRADSLFRAAGRADPTWARPWIARGWAMGDRALLQDGETRERTLELAMALADSAVRRAPSEAEPYELRGTLRFRQVTALNTDTANSARLGQAEADLRAAMARDSLRASSVATLSYLLWLKASLEESVFLAQRALDLDAFLANARDIYQQLFYGELMLGDLAQAEEWCQRGARANPGNWRFVECRLTLARQDNRRAPDAAGAWNLVAELDRLDPPEKARASGHPYSPVYRRVVAAVISARAGDRARARGVLVWARGMVAKDTLLKRDLAPDEAHLLLALGHTVAARTILLDVLRRQGLLAPLLRRDPVLGPLLGS